MLAVLQSFDPPGICARDLAECLAIQLRERDRSIRRCRRLITRLDLLAKRDFAALKKICGVDDEDLADMIGRNPPPQSEAGPRVRLGAWCSRSCPTCSCGRGPTAAGSSNSTPTPCRRCWSTRPTTPRCRRRRGATPTNPISPIACRTPPGWCARSTSAPAPFSRSPTRSCASRTRFFAHGVEHLRPLNLKTVAEAIGMHESTVSRVTANKYMATSRGIFELKYFFTSSIASAARRRSALGGSGAPPHQAIDRRRKRRRRICPTTPSWRSCARPASTSRGARSRNTARPCASPPRCSGGARSRPPRSIERRCA